jgi:uncharacterized protein (DUF885 family)
MRTVVLAHVAANFPASPAARIGGAAAKSTTMKTLFLIPVLLCLVLAPLHAVPSSSFDAWADQISADWVRLSPHLATRTQYFSGAEQEALDRQLGLIGEEDDVYGRAAAEARAALARRGLEELRRFPRNRLTRTQQSSAALLEWWFKNAVEAAPFAQGEAVFRQFGGLQLELVNFLTQTHPIRNRRDVENYLARLEQVAPVLDRGLAEARAAEDAGYLSPRFIVQRTIEQLDGFLLSPPQDNVFVVSLRTRAAALGDAIPAAEREQAVAAAEKIAGDAVIPA